MRRLACLLSLSLAGWATAQSTGYASFQNTVFAKFNQQDIALMMARVDEALKSDASQPLDWKNDKTVSSGRVTALDRHVWEGLPCRRVRLLQVHGDARHEATYRFCEKPPGSWKLAGIEQARP